MASASSSLAAPNVGRANTARQLPAIQPHNGCRVRGLSAPLLARQSNPSALLVKSKLGAAPLGQCTLGAHARSQWRTYAAATDEPAEEREEPADDVAASGEADEGAEWEEEYEYDEAEAIIELSEDDLSNRNVLVKQIADISDSAGGIVETSAEEDKTQKESDEVVDVWLDTVMEVESMVADNGDETTDGKIELPFSDRGFFEEIHATLGELNLVQEVAKDFAPDTFDPVKALYKHVPIDGTVTGYVDGLEQDLKMLDEFEVEDTVDFDEDEQKLLAVLDELHASKDSALLPMNPLATLFNSLEHKEYTAEEQQLLDSIKGKPDRPLSAAVAKELAPYVALTLEACGTPKPMEYIQSGATMLNKLVEIAGATPAGEWLHSATDSLSAARKDGKLSAAEFEQLSSAVAELQADLKGHTVQVDQGLFEVFNEKVAEVHKYGYPLPVPEATAGIEEDDIAQLLKDAVAKYPELADAEMDAVLASMGESNEDEEDVEATIMRAAKDLLEPAEYQAFLEEVESQEATEDELLDARDILVEAAKKQGAAAAARVFGKVTVMAMSQVDEVDEVKVVEVPDVTPDLSKFMPSAEESAKISQLAVGAQLFVSSEDQLTSQVGSSDGWGPEAYLSDDDEVMQEYKNLKSRYAEFNIDIDEHLADPSISKQMRGGASASDIELTARILKNAAEGKEGAELLAGGPEGSERSAEEEKILQMLRDLRDQDASFQEVYNMAEAGDWEGLDKPVVVPYSEKEQAILDMLQQQPGYSAEAKAAIQAATEPVPLPELEEEEDALTKFLPVLDLSDVVVEELVVTEASGTIQQPVTLEELAIRSHVDQMDEVAEEEQDEEEPVAVELDADTPFDADIEASMMNVDAETLEAEVSSRMGDIVYDDDAEGEESVDAALERAQALMAEFESMEGARTEDGELTEAAMAKLAEAQEAFEAAEVAADPDVAAWREAAETASLELELDNAVRAEADAAGVALPPSVDPNMDEEEAIDFMQAFAQQMEQAVEEATAQPSKASSMVDAVSATGAGLVPEIDVDALEAELKAMLGSDMVAQAEAAADQVDVAQLIAAARPGATEAEEQAVTQATMSLMFSEEDLEALNSQASMLDEEEAEEAEAAEEVDPMEEVEALLGPVSSLESRSAEAEAEEDEEELEVEVAEGEDGIDEGDVTFDGLIAEVVNALEEVDEDDEEAEYLEVEGDEADTADEGDDAILASADGEADDDDEEDEDVELDEEEENEEAYDDADAYAGYGGDEEDAMAYEEAEEDDGELGDDEDMEVMDALEEEEDEEGADTDEAQAAIQASLESQFYEGLEVDEEEAEEEEEDLDEDQGAANQDEDGQGATDNDDELSTEYNTLESELLAPTFDDIWEEMGVVELRPKEPVKPRPEVEANADAADQELDEDAARDELDDDEYEEEDAMEDEVEDDPIAKYYAKGEDEEDEAEEDGTDNAYALTSGLALFGESPSMGDDEDRAADDATGLLERVTMSKAGDVFVERIIQVGRVTKVVKGGKIMSFRCVAVVGNKNGCVGVGVDSAREVVQAVQKAVTAAKKNLVVVPLTKSDSIPHRVEAKYKSAACVINPAGEGTGCIAGGAVRSVLELAGVKNVLAKRLGSRNPLNNARATVRALEQLQTWGEVASKRDVSLEYLFAPNSAESERAFAAARGAGQEDSSL